MLKHGRFFLSILRTRKKTINQAQAEVRFSMHHYCIIKMQQSAKRQRKSFGMPQFGRREAEIGIQNGGGDEKGVFEVHVGSIHSLH